jgi:hypothetical protein
LLFGWWTLGVANVVYAMWQKHVSEDRVEVVTEDAGRD